MQNVPTLLLNAEICASISRSFQSVDAFRPHMLQELIIPGEISSVVAIIISQTRAWPLK